ncbi:MAG: SEC-C domain-containing protein, partial [Zetaproteobacteria bacterium]|nr:SEC-C domain-containing protein [Zetaproteobacteria bacterium]
ELLIAALPAKLSDNDRAQKVAEIKATIKEEHDAVVANGGLYILGTERHESRRIDNQLRGRAGRQGDPGTTRFYLSLEDDLMRIFGGEKMQAMLTKMGFEKGEMIEHPWVSKAIENSQKKVEGRNFDVRKQLLEYDDVMNQQRDVIYSQRRELMAAEHIQDIILDMQQEFIRNLCNTHLQGLVDDWNVEGLTDEVREKLAIKANIQKLVDELEVQDAEHIATPLLEAMQAHIQYKESKAGVDQMRAFERWLVLNLLDHHWKDHLLAMDHLRQSVGLRGYAQKQPLQEYKRESFELFSALLGKVREETVMRLHQVEVQDAPKPEPQPELHYNHEDDDEDQTETTTTYRRENAKIGRNDPCPCGSGQKYKQCHGKR